MDNYGFFAIVLLVAGLAVLVTEVFIPSGGILAIVTTLMLLSSIACASAAWFDKAPFVFWGFVGLVVLAVPTSLGSALYILPQTKTGRRALLQAPELTKVEPFQAETARLRGLIGQFGTTASLLNPGGLVLLNGERLHACSEGMIVEPRTSVEIIDVRGTRVVVRPGQPPETPPTKQNEVAVSPLPIPNDEPMIAANTPPTIDFEITSE